MSDPFDDAATSIVAILDRGIDAPVALQSPRESSESAAVDVHLLGMHPGTKERHGGLHRLPIRLDFLVSVTGPGDAVAGLFHDVIVAIDSSAEHELTRDMVPIDWWPAFGVPPRPAVRVHVDVDIERTVEEAPIVTEALHIEPQFHRTRLGAANERRA